VEIRSENVYRFGVEPDVVWDAFARVGDYHTWWPWLREFDARGLAEGECWSCVVRPPLPYELRFRIEMIEVRPPWSIEATVEGDIAGRAGIVLSELTDGTEIRLSSQLAPRRKLLRTVSRYSPWLARYGHDWVLDTGLSQFDEHAL
jgi:hypothetical protein